MPELHVVVVGNPSDGFTYYGPFTVEQVDAFTEDLAGQYWWIATLHQSV